MLGFSALQLSPDRDHGAPHAENTGGERIDLRALAGRRLIVNLPRTLLDSPPPLEPYARGTWGPPSADAIPSSHGGWRIPQAEVRAEPSA